MVAKRHKITNVPLLKKLWDIIFLGGDNNFLSHFSGHFEGASTFLTPKLSRAQRQENSGRSSNYKCAEKLPEIYRMGRESPGLRHFQQSQEQ